MTRSGRARLVRDGRVVWEGKIGSLRRFKDDVREVSAGYECGIGLENFNDVKPGDVIESFEMEAIARKLETPRRTRCAGRPRPRSIPRPERRAGVRVVAAFGARAPCRLRLVARPLKEAALSRRD